MFVIQVDTNPDTLYGMPVVISTFVPPLIEKINAVFSSFSSLHFLDLNMFIIAIEMISEYGNQLLSNILLEDVKENSIVHVDLSKMGSRNLLKLIDEIKNPILKRHYNMSARMQFVEDDARQTPDWAEIHPQILSRRSF